MAKKITDLTELTTAEDADLVIIQEDSSGITKKLSASNLAAYIKTNFGITSFIETLLDDADAATARATLGAQASDAQLTDVAALTPTDGLFIVGNGTNFIGESGATARSSMGAAEQGGEDQIKAWINFNGTGTIAIRDSFNVTSITDNGTGDYTVTWDTDFANSNYAVVGTCMTSGGHERVVNVKESTGAVGSVIITVKGGDGVNIDVNNISLIAIGDQ